MKGLKKFCVTTRVYVWARGANDAATRVAEALNHEVDFGESDICGLISPTTADAVEIKEKVT